MQRRPWVMVAVLLGGCRSEFVIGVQDGGSGSASGEGSTTTATTTASSGTASPGSSGSSGAATDTSGSTTAPDCSDGDESDGAATLDGGGGESDPPQCMAPTGHSQCDQQDADPFHALGLDCSGGVDETTPISNGRLMADGTTAVVATRYGADGNTHWGPTEGSKLLALTTGTFDVVGDHVEVPPGRTWGRGGDNPNPSGELPPPIVPRAGPSPDPCDVPFRDCDDTRDCSGTLPGLWDDAGGVAHDVAWFTFDVAVPLGTFGYRVDVAWFSAEYPELADAPASDVLVWWQSSEAFTGNIATIGAAPLTVAGLAETIATSGFVGNAPELVGTGYESTEVDACETPWVGYPAGQCPNAGATDWLTLEGIAHPGEILTTSVALFDVGGTDIDTAVLVDNWRWSCAGCVPGESCGVGPRVTP